MGMSRLSSLQKVLYIINRLLRMLRMHVTVITLAAVILTLLSKLYPFIKLLLELWALISERGGY